MSLLYIVLTFIFNILDPDSLTSFDFLDYISISLLIIMLKFIFLVQSISPCEGSQSIPNKGSENGAEPWDAKLDLWKPLNFLVEVASRSKSFKSNNVQGSDAKLETNQVNESDSQVQKTKNKENKRKAKIEDEKSSPYPVSSDTAKPNKLRRIRKKKETASGESGISPQAVLDSASNNRLSRTGPIWFSLVASENQ